MLTDFFPLTSITTLHIPSWASLTFQAVGTYIKMVDLSAKYKAPCMADIKMGRQSYDETASPDKRAYEISKFPLLEKLGFRVIGMKASRRSERGEVYSTIAFVSVLRQDTLFRSFLPFTILNISLLILGPCVVCIAFSALFVAPISTGIRPGYQDHQEIRQTLRSENHARNNWHGVPRLFARGSGTASDNCQRHAGSVA